MTKDEKIKEVMELAGEYGDAVEASALIDGDWGADSARLRAYKAIEAKLRELIQ